MSLSLQKKTEAQSKGAATSSTCIENATQFATRIADWARFFQDGGDLRSDSDPIKKFLARLDISFVDEKLVNAFFNDCFEASKERARLSKAISLEHRKALSIGVFILPEQLKSSREEDRLLYVYGLLDGCSVVDGCSFYSYFVGAEKIKQYGTIIKANKYFNLLSCRRSENSGNWQIIREECQYFTIHLDEPGKEPQT